MKTLALRILTVVAAIVGTAWVSTFVLIWISLSPLPGTSVWINPLVPLRPTVSVRYVDKDGTVITGMLKYKGVRCDSGEWWNNGIWIGSNASDLTVFSGPARSDIHGLSFSSSSDNFHTVNQWSFEDRPILRELRNGTEQDIAGVLPQMAGYVALIFAWRRRKQEPGPETSVQSRAIRHQILWAYGLMLLALISGATLTYCQLPFVRLPIFENAAIPVGLGAMLLSLSAVLRVIRGGKLPLSLLTLPLCLVFSCTVTFWLLASGIL